MEVGASTGAIPGSTGGPGSTGDPDSAETGGSGETSSGSSGGDDGIEATCELFESRFAGEIESDAIGFEFVDGGVTATTLGTAIAFDGGRAYLRNDLQHVQPPRPVTGLGYLRMPDSGARPRQWYCAADSSQFSSPSDGSYHARLSGLRSLGACPGDPVDGELSICFGDPSCGGTAQLVGEVDGNTLDLPIGYSVGAGGKIGGSELDIEFDIAMTSGGIARVQAVGIDYNTIGPQQTAVEHAYFIVPVGQPDEGAIYCARSGSTLDYSIVQDFPEPIAAHLTDLSRLGTCDGTAGTDGTAEICMNYGP